MKISFANQVSSVKPLYDYLKKQQENRKFIKSLEISATFLLVTFFLYFAVRPTFMAISTLNGQIESKKLLKKELKNKINNVITAQDLFSQVQEKYQVINSSLPDRPSFFDSSYQIQKTGADVNVITDKQVFDFNKIENANVDPNLRYYSINLGIKGGYGSTINLISELLKNRRIININSIRLTTPSNSSSASPSATGEINSQFSAVLYYWPDQNEKK